MPTRPKNVDQYLVSGCGRCSLGGTPQCKVHTWAAELRLLRGILQETGLTEEVKWGSPCYTDEGKNIVMLSSFKENVKVTFFRGVQLTDPKKILETPGENSRFARYIRFVDAKSIGPLKSTILSYVSEAIAVEKSGKKMDASLDAPLAHPEELIQLFEANPDFEEAFAALTPGRQRGYLIYFSSAKQSKTKTARIEKYMPKIFSGKGWNE